MQDYLTGLMGREREGRREVRRWKGWGPLGWPVTDGALCVHARARR